MISLSMADKLDGAQLSSDICVLSAPSHRDAENLSDRILSRVGRQLALSGFDLVEPLCIGWYNEAVSELPDSQIPVSSTTGQGTLALLVGNSRLFWDHFLDTCRQDSHLLHCDNPVEQYTEDCLARAVAAEWSQNRIFFSHEQSAGHAARGFVAMQRLAEVTGCAYNDHTSHLSLHPRFGPWFALRALVVFDGVKFTGTPKPKLRNPLSLQTESYIRTIIRSAQTCSHPAPSTCEPGATVEGDDLAAEAMCRQWPKWVAVRDAPFPGHPWRYPDAMIAYHYTSDRRVLRDAVKLHHRRRSSEEQLGHAPRHHMLASY